MSLNTIMNIITGSRDMSIAVISEKSVLIIFLLEGFAKFYFSSLGARYSAFCACHSAFLYLGFGSSNTLKTLSLM